MFSFTRTDGYELSEDLIQSIEVSYDFHFPPLLKEYYMLHNEALVVSKDFIIEDDEYNLARFIYPIVKDAKGVSICTLLEMEKRRQWFGKGRIPFASDWGDDIYCWDNSTGSVYLYYPDEEMPVYLTESIEKFFGIINQ